MDDLNGPDVEIRPAATLILLRDTKVGYKDINYEIFMLRRNLNSDFIGGAFVFPGGGLLTDDSDETVLKRCRNFDFKHNDARFNLSSGSIAYFIAAVRETFEEAGILVGLCQHDNNVDFQTYRDQLNLKRIKFSEFLEIENLYLDLSEIVYFSHWTTPIGPPRRYSTRFFVTKVDPKFELSHDNGETVESRWINPKLALELSTAGEIEIIFPTFKNIEKLLSFGSSEELIQGLAQMQVISEVTPKIVLENEEFKILIPGDEGF